MFRTARILVLVATALAVGGALVAAPAALGSPSQVVRDCNAHAKLTGHYSVTDLQTALNTLPADVREYTDCYDVIHGQLLAQLSGKQTGAAADAGSGGSFLPTPLLIVLLLLIAVAAWFSAVALRRRR